jgi:hypothetical protein
VQPFVVLQAYFPRGKLLTIELGFTDNTGTLRRLIFTQGRETVKNQLHARIPADAIVRDCWVNLCIDVVSFIRECFPSCTMRSVDSISISGMALIKRVFTMRMRLRDTSSEGIDANYYYEPIPVPCEFPRHSPSLNQFFDMDRVLGQQQMLAYSTSPPKMKTIAKKVQFKNIFTSVSPPPTQKLTKVTSNQGENPFALSLLEKDTGLLKVHSQAVNLDEWMKQMLEVRHFTPPFVNVQDDRSHLRYDPVLKTYELAAEVS